MSKGDLTIYPLKKCHRNQVTTPTATHSSNNNIIVILSRVKELKRDVTGDQMKRLPEGLTIQVLTDFRVDTTFPRS